MVFQIAFEGYSGIDCQLMWEGISKRIRKYRILQELVDEAKKMLSKPGINIYEGRKKVFIFCAYCDKVLSIFIYIE